MTVVNNTPPRFPLLLKMHGHAECRYIGDLSAWQHSWQQEHRYWHPDDMLIDSEGRCYGFDTQNALLFHPRAPLLRGLPEVTQLISQPVAHSHNDTAKDKDADHDAHNHANNDSTSAAQTLSLQQVTALVQAHFFAQHNSCVSKIHARSIAELISYLADSD
jgi:hypothetical protein